MQLLFFFLFYLICTLVSLTPFALSGASSREEDADEFGRITFTESEKRP